MSLQLITEEYCLKLGAIIDETQLEREIEIKNKNLDLELKANRLLKSKNYCKYKDYGKDTDMMGRRFFFGKKRNVLKKNKKDYDLTLRLGSWGYNARIEYSHLLMETSPKLFRNEYFNRIELSQSFEDKNTIYIVKNLSQITGKDALTCLNYGVKSKEEKLQRRGQLVEHFKGEVIPFKKHDWICIDAIKKNTLNKKINHPEILYKLLKKLLVFAFTIEEIIAAENK